MRIDMYKHGSIKFFIAGLAIAFHTLPGFSQVLQLNLDVSRDTIFIGERTEILLSIRKDENVRLALFPLKDSLPGEIEILDSLRTSGPDSLNLRYLVTSFSPGNLIIPKIPLVFTFNNATDTIYSSGILLTVLSPEVNNEAEIRDIKPPLDLPFRLKEIIPETGIIIGLLALLALLAVFIARRMKKKKNLVELQAKLPAHVIAFGELERLKAEKLWQNGKIKEYYSRLSDIMRVYLEKRFGINAMEYVSSETLHAFRKAMPHEELLQKMLGEILFTSDMVKFAKEDPLPSENQGNMDNAYLFIGQTRIEELTVPEENEVQKENIIEEYKPGIQ